MGLRSFVRLFGKAEPDWQIGNHTFRRITNTAFSHNEKESVTPVDSQSVAPPQGSVGLYIRQSYKQQLQPGDKLEVLETKILRSLTKSIDTLYEKCISLSSKEKTTISILQWTKAALLDAGTAALYGDQLIDIEPDFIQHFSAFDHNSWMLLYHYPKFLSDPVNIPKRKVLEAFTAYFELPVEKRRGVAEFLQTIEAEQRKISLDNRDIASSAFIFYFA